MNFMEAVKAMREGKKVSRGIWKVPNFIFIDSSDDIRHSTGNYIYEGYILDFEATDWEIVYEDKDKDWNLAFNGRINYNDVKDIKKCRDLILEDIKEKVHNRVDFYECFEEIIKKRFGDI